MKTMYLDDIRTPVLEYDYIVRSSNEAIENMIRYGCPNQISFDHDLGGDDTAMVVVKYMIERDLDEDSMFIPLEFDFYVHSANPVGAANIKGYLTSYLNNREL